MQEYGMKVGFLYLCTRLIMGIMAKVKTGIVQMSCSADKAQNLAKAIEKVREAAAKGAQIICLQELFTSLYFCDVEDYENFKLAEPVPGPSTEALGKVAAELGVVIIASLFEKRAEGLYHNTTAVLDADGKYLGKYRKMHIPDDPAYYEKFYFTPGDLGYKVFQTKFAKIGVLICWDQWYPEAARITALMGAEILFYPTAIGWATSQDEATNVEQYNAWQTIQRSHAVANGIHVVSVNRVGLEQDGLMKFWGGSFIANPFGSLLHLSPHDQEETVVLELDLSKTDRYRTHWPFLRDRRIDSYQPITKRYIDDEA
ncbi:N-carbamoylputrescine amidase [Chitinophaga niabensis]|uniref:N-carbamoylputrescine amidase n=2 Tax=Chitinophaga niabensis TaxID=536979 RepID=A0A1N6D131_9BACT|nr:N-carbamoylputrescine amidase [Chitinophaga niabensis]